MNKFTQAWLATLGAALATAVGSSAFAQETGAAPKAPATPAPVATQAVGGTVTSETIVVSATRIPQAARDAGVSVTVVPRERIEELKAQNVGEVLKNVTDARLDCYGGMGARSELSLRGSTPQQVLLMVDGRPVNEASIGLADLATFPVDQVERIEVIRGPASVLYGAGAMAGVVNIITRDPPETLRTDATASYGTKNTHLLRLDNGAKFGDFGYLVTGSQNGSDGWRANSACEGYNLSGKLTYDLSLDSRLTLNSGFIRQNKGVPGSTSFPSPDAKQHDRKWWGDLTHKYEFDPKTWLTSKIFLNQDWQHYNNPEVFTDTTARNQKAGLDVQQTLPWGEQQLWLGGIYLENDVVNVENAADVSQIGGQRDLFTGAGFLQDEIKPLEPLTLTPGLRCDVQSKWGAELSPKLSGLYKITDATRLKASIGRGFRAPTVDELYWRDDYSEGNPDLKPEESFSYDAGVQQLFGKRSMLEVSLFQSRMKNLIAWFDDGKGIYRAQNINDALLQGLETDLNLQLTEEISGGANYTLLGAEDTSGTYDGKTLTYRPKNKIGGRLGYQSSFGLKLSVNAEYTASVYTDRSNAKELGGFFTLGASAAQTVLKSVEIFARGDNLLNKEYQLVNGYPMPGFSITGGVKATF
jgi:outer membrane cobalamin receptor